MKKINHAIIGAGLAGLACANRLQAAGQTVEVFEKARGAGGAFKQSPPFKYHV